MTNSKFAIIVGNDVAGTVSLQEGVSDIMDRIIAAYKSDPKIVQIFDENIQFGWTYNNSEFIPPAI